MTPKRSLKELLAEHPFFQGLERPYLELIAGCARNVRFNAGTYIFREGEPATAFYLLRYGRVALEVHLPDRGTVTIQTLNEGDVLGWSWLVPPYRNQFDARALTLVRALAFDGACIRQKCAEDPRLGYEIFSRFTRIIVERLQATRLQLLDMYGAAPRRQPLHP
ncbi:MAG: cyclic nucleotide-binding domain-containing protein [Rhodothermus sp.]|nr:cyclic nucleotide-binding domain-containing protein [Rhodothermus sp.]